MQFDSNRAWREASALVAANRDVLVALGGVFFLLPAIGSVLVMGDFQAEMLASFGKPEAAQQAMAAMGGQVIGFGLISFVFQSVGYLGMLALLTDRTRPTVGEALGGAVKALPSVVGAALLFFAAYMGAVLVVALLAAALGSITGLGALVAVLVLALIVGVVYVMVKFSLVLPVIVIERIANPVTALARSWRLTKGNSLRLFAFYLLLTIVYFVIVMIFGIAVMGIAVLIAGQGKLASLIGGGVTSIVGAAASVMLTAVLAAIHRQLAGPSPDVLGATFD